MGIEEIGNEFVTILHSLMAAKMIGLAGRFLYICQTQLKGILPDTSHALVVGEEVSLAYARHLFFDCGNAMAAFFYCQKADEKGEILEREIETLLSGATQEKRAVFWRIHNQNLLLLKQLRKR